MPVRKLRHITICGLGAVRSDARQEKFSHVISIRGAGAHPGGPDEIRSLFSASRFHMVRFDDIEVGGGGALTIEMMRNILAFGSGTLMRR